MREIKFRVWDKKDKEMLRVVAISFDEAMFMPHNIDYEDYYNYNNNFYSDLMQYTGLKDKNGVEIYEGDIVEWIDGGERPFIYEIIYDDCGYYAKSSNNEKISIGGTMHSDMNINIEVIGNIYENKELLNE